MSDNWYDGAKGGYIYGPLEVPKTGEPPHEGITLGEYMKETFAAAIEKRDARIAALEEEVKHILDKVKPLEYSSGRNPTLAQVIINLVDVYGLPEPVINHPDTFDFPFAVEEKLHQLTAELTELRGIITDADYRRMDELVKQWEKEKNR